MYISPNVQDEGELYVYSPPDIGLGRAKTVVKVIATTDDEDEDYIPVDIPPPMVEIHTHLHPVVMAQAGSQDSDIGGYTTAAHLVGFSAFTYMYG